MTVCEEPACGNEATVLARSMHETAPELWTVDVDHLWCPLHFVPGTMTFLDASVTHHAPMSAEDA